MKRCQLAKGILLAGSVVFSNLGIAVGLGDFEVQSFINEPLRFEVDLVDLDSSKITDLRAVIAPFEDPQTAGIDFNPELADLEVSVTDDGLLVTSSQPITAPFINVLVQIDWSSGRLRREYMILLDPPVALDKEGETVSAVVNAPAVENQDQPSQPSFKPPVFDQSQVTPADAEPKVGEANTVDLYTVQKGDTLWELALRYRPSASLSVQQMMLAIQQQNPSAFAGENINRLLAGQTLRIPNTSEIQRISEAMALAEVKRQNQWLLTQQQAAQVETAVARQLGAEDASPETNDLADTQTPASTKDNDSLSATDKVNAKTNLGSVRLITNQDTPGTISEGAGDPESQQQQIAALNSELALAMEDLDRSRRENNQLVNDLSLLQQQKEAIQRLLELKENQLAVLQNSEQIQAAQRENSTATDTAQNASEVVVADKTPVTEKPSWLEPDNLKATTTHLVESLRKYYDEFKLWLLGFGLLAAVLGLLALQRRKGGTTDKTADTDDLATHGNNDLDEQVKGAAASQATNSNTSDKDDELASETSPTRNHSDLLDNAVPDTQAAIKTISHQDELPSVYQIIQESKQFTQQGRFAKAVELLSQALEYYPQDIDLTMQLMEVAIELQDVSLFYRYERSLPHDLNEARQLKMARLQGLIHEFEQEAELISQPAELISQPAIAPYSHVTDSHGTDSAVSAVDENDQPNTIATPINDEVTPDNSVQRPENDNEEVSVTDAVDVTPTVAAGHESSATSSLTGEGLAATESSQEKTQPDNPMTMPSSNTQAEGDLDPEIVAMFEGMNLQELEADDEFDFLASTDECSTKLDLARAFIDMEDNDGALTLLQEVVEEGNDEQQTLAKKLIQQISSD